MNSTLVDALDDVSSSRSSLVRQSRALDVLEHVLASICVSTGETPELDVFLKLQDGFECNIASRLMHSISTFIPTLQKYANMDNVMDPDAQSISRIVIQCLSILQGVALLHPSSKSFLGKKWCIQIFADLLSISRHMAPTPLSSTTNTMSSPPAPSSAALASSTIDTLLCVLVDAPPALRAFEEVDGIEMVVKILKRTGVAKDIRIKCIEFLYFYLLDETGEVTLAPGVKPTAIEPSPQKGSRAPTPIPWSSDTSTSSSRPSSPDYTTPPRTPRKVVPSNLALLRKDLDFVPITPKKVSRLGVGTPRTGLGGRVPHRARPGGRSSPVEISVIPASPTKRRCIIQTPLGSTNAGGNRGNCLRSTEEKKDILGSLLGNVDVLVEGVAKSGVWGLG